MHLGSIEHDRISGLWLGFLSAWLGSATVCGVDEDQVVGAMIDAWQACGGVS